MTKQITLQMSETDAINTFVLTEGFVERFANNQLTDGEFEAVVDSVYATLTSTQKKSLFADALESHYSIVDFFADKPTAKDVYQVSAKDQLAICINCSIADYLDEVSVN